MRKRILSAIIAIVMVIGLVPIGALTVSAASEDTWDGTTAATAFDSGTGTVDDPYVIMTAEQLAKLASDVNGGTYYTDTYFKLGANIDLAGATHNWTPIGGYHTKDQTAATAKNNTFAGVLDGNGKTISNMSSTTEDSAYSYNGYRALFGNLSGTVMNLTLDSPKVSAAYQYVAGLVAYSNGGTIKNITVNTPSIEATQFGTTRYGVSAIVGYLTNGSTVENCHVTGGTISTVNPGVGAVAGYLDGTSIKNCSATNVAITYTSSATRVGSVVGAVVNADVTDCHATGCSITGTHAATSGYGGIVGYAEDATVSDCTVKNANLSVASQDVGGIVGHLNYVDGTNVVKNCFVESSTVKSTSAPVAGVVGYSFGNSASVNTIKNCGVTDGSVIAEYNVGGIVGNAYQTNVIGCYNHGMDVVANESFSSVSAGGISGYNGKIYSCFSSTTVSLPNSTSTRFGPIGGDYSTANFCAYDSTVYNSTNGYTYMGEGYTEEQVRSGEVAYYLSTQGTSNSNAFTDWKQTIGTQDYPSLVGKKVFYDAAATPKYYNNVTYTVTLPTATAKGSVSASTVDASAGETVTLTVTPATNYELSSISVTAEDNTPVTVIDNKFTMPASNVTVTAEFTFVKKNATITVNETSFTYNGSPQPVSIELPADLDEQYVTVTYYDGYDALLGAPTNAGEYKFSVSIEGSPIYKDENVFYDMVINPKKLDFLWVSVVTPTDGFVFNASPHEPDVRLYIDGTYTPIDEVGGCKVTYENNTNAGNATVKITGNYEATAGFIIKKATPVIYLGAPVTKVLSGYIMEVNPTTNAVDKLGDPSYSLTILDGEGYSVSGNVITIDEGLAIGTTITVKVQYAETTNYVGIISEHQLEVGVPSADTTELEKKIDELKALIDSNTASITDINKAIANINAELALLDTNYVTHTELTEALADINNAIKKLNDETIDTILKAVAKNGSDITALDTTIKNLESVVSALPTTAVTDKLTTDLSALSTELSKLTARVEANEIEIAGIKLAIEKLNKLIEDGGTVDQINEELRKINDALDALDGTYVDHTELTEALFDIIEAIKDINDKAIPKIENNVATNANDITNLKASVDGIKDAIASLAGEDRRLASLIGTLDTELDDLSISLDALKARLDKAEKDIESLRSELAVKYAELYAYINANKNDITLINDTLKSINAIIATLASEADVEAEVEAVGALIEALTDRVRANEDDIAANNGEISRLQSTLRELSATVASQDAALAQNISTLSSILTVLETRVEQNKQDISALRNDLSKAINELKVLIEEGDNKNADAITKAIKDLTTLIRAVESAAAYANEELKAELTAQIKTASDTLDAAIQAVQKDLDNAKAELDKAIENGDKELANKIEALSKALSEAKAALEAADATHKTELTAKINEAEAKLNAAIKALEGELESLKKALDGKDSELDQKAEDLKTFVIIVCVISSVALVGSGAFITWFFIDRKKKI